jgi:hypothetical protein
MARPPYKPTDKDRRTVEAMVGYGITHEQIAKAIGINPKTLRKHFREEIDTGEVKANAKVAESLYLQATGAPAVYDAAGRVVRAEQPRVTTAAIWWTKARMGWKETVENEHRGGLTVQVVKFADDTPSR